MSFGQRLWMAFVVSVLLAVGAPVARADDERVGEVFNFGPSLFTAAGGVCQQGEGLDPEGNVYVDSQDQIGGVGHICVLSPRGELIDTIEVPPGPSGVVSMIGEYWHDESRCLPTVLRPAINGTGRPELFEVR